MNAKLRNVGFKVRELLGAGVANSEICRVLRVSAPTVCYHARKLNIPHTKRPTYDWPAIQNFYDADHSIEACTKEFGCSKDAIAKATKDGRFISREPPRYISAKQYAANNAGKCGRTIRWHLKQKIIKEGLLTYKCKICSIAEWNGAPLDLRLDHIDGNNTDHSENNIRFLCPNCDSQQETYCHRNVGKRKRTSRPADSPG